MARNGGGGGVGELGEGLGTCAYRCCEDRLREGGWGWGRGEDRGGAATGGGLYFLDLPLFFVRRVRFLSFFFICFDGINDLGVGSRLTFWGIIVRLGLLTALRCFFIFVVAFGLGVATCVFLLVITDCVVPNSTSIKMKRRCLWKRKGWC